MSPQDYFQTAPVKPYELPSSFMHRIHDHLPRDSDPLLQAIDNAVQCAFKAGFQSASAPEDKAESPPGLKMKFMDGSPVEADYEAAITKLTSGALQAEELFSLDELEDAAQSKPPTP